MEERLVEIKVEALEGSKVKATVTVDAKTVESYVKKTYKDFANKGTFPGFRKGKAPRKVIDNVLGAEYVMATATEEVVNAHYPLAVEDQKLFPVGQPDFENADLVESGKEYTFSFTVEVKPEFELSSYEPVAVELPCAEVTEAEMTEQLDAMRQHYATFEDASAATKLKAENTADFAMKATDEEGNAIEALESESRLFTPASGMFPESFDAEVLGMKKGQTKEFTIEVADDDSSVLLAGMGGKKINFEVTCNVVKKKTVPELTDEWVKEVMALESVEDLRARIDEAVSAQKAGMLPRLKENACMAELVKRFEGDAPASMVEDSESALLQEFFGQLQRQGMNFDAYLMQQGITADKFKADVKLQAADDAKEKLALDAWARHAGIEATAEEVTAEFTKAGLPDAAAVEEEWRKNGRLYLIREGIVRAKALEDVMDTAVVTEVDYAAQAAAEAKKPAKKKSAKKDEVADSAE